MKHHYKLSRGHAQLKGLLLWSRPVWQKRWSSYFVRPSLFKELTVWRTCLSGCTMVTLLRNNHVEEQVRSIKRYFCQIFFLARLHERRWSLHDTRASWAANTGRDLGKILKNVSGDREPSCLSSNMCSLRQDKTSKYSKIGGHLRVTKLIRTIWSN